MVVVGRRIFHSNRVLWKVKWMGGVKAFYAADPGVINEVLMVCVTEPTQLD